MILLKYDDPFIESLNSDDVEELKKYINKDNVNCLAISELKGGYKVLFKTDLEYDENQEFDKTPLGWVLYSSPIEMAEYLISIGANTEFIQKKKDILFELISQEYDNYYHDPVECILNDKRIKLLVKYGADINIEVDNHYKLQEYICRSNKMTPLNKSFGCFHKPAEEYLFSIEAKTARELEKEELLSKENTNEYEKLLLACFNKDIDYLKKNITEENIKGLEGYIYTLAYAILESQNLEIIYLLLKFEIENRIIKRICELIISFESERNKYVESYKVSHDILEFIVKLINEKENIAKKDIISLLKEKFE